MIPFFEDEIFIEKFNEVKKPKGRVVLGIHQGIQGATTNSGLPIESALTSNHFREYDLVLVGHYHDQQQFENINYIGASIQHNFGESSTKGATLLYDDLFPLELIPFEFLNISHLK